MKVIKDWIIAHKLLSIIIATIVVVGITTSIILPITLKHRHNFVTEWSYDNESHWNICTGKKCNEVADKTAHIYDSEADANCKVCGATRTLPTRYKAKDEAEWNSAISLKNINHFSVTVDNDEFYGEIIRNGDVIKLVEYEKGESGKQKVGETYYVKDGESYYRVSLVEGSEEIYERKYSDKENYDEMLESFVLFVLGKCKYSDFTFNEANNSYSNEDATSVHTLTFVGGKIFKVEAVVKGLFADYLDMAVVTTITFEENELTVPSYRTIDATRYENALNLKDENGEFYKNVDVVFVNGTTKVFEYKVTENSAYYYHRGDSNNEETIWTNEDGKGVVYTKKDASSKWVKTEQAEEFKDFASCVFPVSTFKNYLKSLPFEKLTFSKEDQMYHGTYKQSSNSTVEISMSFVDGKLMQILYTINNIDTSSSVINPRTITYGDAVIEIPTID